MGSQSTVFLSVSNTVLSSTATVATVNCAHCSNCWSRFVLSIPTKYPSWKKLRPRPGKGCDDEDVKSEGGSQGLLITLKMMTQEPQCFAAWIIIINFNVINSIPAQALAPPFDFTSFSSQPFQILATTFLQLRCFCWDFISFLHVTSKHL